MSVRKFLISLSAAILPFSAALAAVPGDYNGDGRSELAVATVNRTAQTTTISTYNVVDDSTASTVLQATGDAFVPADYDGNGTIDHAVVTVQSDGQLAWHIMIDGSEQVSVFGLNGDMPVGGDFDCDSKADRAVARKIGGRVFWWMQLSGGGTLTNSRFGIEGDKFFVAKVISTSCDSLVIARKAGAVLRWYYKEISQDNYSTFDWGLSTDTPLGPIDFDADGIADFVRASGSLLLAKLVSGDQETAFDTQNATPYLGFFNDSTTPVISAYTRGTGQTSSHFTFTEDAGAKDIAFGSRSNILLRPDGTAVQAGEAAFSCLGLPVVSIDSLSYVLYKAENIHGGRGPTFLVQNVAERTNKRKIRILNVNCGRIGSFGLYRTDYPYGSRYYQKTGGSGFSDVRLRTLAERAGSTNILVEGKGKWIVVNDPLQRQGTIKNP